MCFIKKIPLTINKTTKKAKQRSSTTGFSCLRIWWSGLKKLYLVRKYREPVLPEFSLSTTLVIFLFWRARAAARELAAGGRFSSLLSLSSSEEL